MELLLDEINPKLVGVNMNQIKHRGGAFEIFKRIHDMG